MSLNIQEKERNEEAQLVKGVHFHWYLYLGALLIWGYLIEAATDYRAAFLNNLLASFSNNSGKTAIFFMLWVGLITATIFFTEVVFFIWKKISEIKMVKSRIFFSDLVSAVYVSTLIMFFYVEIMTLPDYFFDKGYFSIVFFNENKTFIQLMGFFPLAGIVCYLVKIKGKEFIRIRAKIFYQ